MVQAKRKMMVENTRQVNRGAEKRDSRAIRAHETWSVPARPLAAQVKHFILTAWGLETTSLNKLFLMPAACYAVLICSPKGPKGMILEPLALEVWIHGP